MDEFKGLEDLPTLALERLIDFLDYESRKTCRLVSRTLKRHVDDIGHSVTIDTSEPGSYDFCQSVAVAEAHVVYMKSVEFSPKTLENWKTLILSGPVTSTWFGNDFQRSCCNLHVLIINDSCLVSQDFTGSVEMQPRIFDNLTRIEISLSSSAMTKAAKQVNALRKQKVTLKTCSYMDARVQKNMTYLMRSIRSRVLKVFKAFVFVHFLQKDSQRKVRWEHEPLFEFIQSHRHTLKEILAPGLFSAEANLEGKDYQMPLNLKTFLVSAGFTHTFLTYWKHMLLAQQFLKNLSMNDMKIPASEVFPLLKVTVSKNSRTLTYIQLSFVNEADETVDIAAFQFCEYLQFFSIEVSGKGNLWIRNLNQLPRVHLTSLKLLGNVCVGPEFDGVKFVHGFKPDSMHIVGCVSTASHFSDFKYTLQFIKLILRSRALNSFFIGFSLDNVPKTWKLFTTAESEEPGLLMWLANLESSGIPNHHCFLLDISDYRDHAARGIQKLNKYAAKENGTHTYVESEAAVDLNYIDLVSRYELTETREQPFHLPRDAESYTIWQNQKTKAFRVQPNTQPYSKRIDDLEQRVKVTINFVLEGSNGNTEFKPLDMHLFTGEAKYYNVIDRKLTTPSLPVTNKYF